MTAPTTAPELVATRRSAAGRLRVRWFRKWDPVLDDALAVLPEMETCPHDLFRTLMQTPGPTEKRAGLILERGAPIALIGLRARKRFWEPVGAAGVAPRSAFPVADGRLFEAAAAAGVDIWMGGWEDAPSPAAASLMRRAFSLPTFKGDCRTGVERHWRAVGNISPVLAARNRTKGFTLEVDHPDAADWIIGGWDTTWRSHPNRETVCAGDQLLAARYFQERGRLHTFRLLDGATPAGGYTGFVYRDTIVLVCGHRDPRYERHGIGVRLFDLVFSWAAQAGFAKVDLGAGHAYKARWAPRDGERWYFNACPLPLYAAKAAVRRVRSFMRGRGGESTASAPSGDPT